MSIATRVRRAPRRPDDADREQSAADIIEGLSKPQKTLPCRYFYDANGSALFEAITCQPEYYLSRTEAAILSRHAGEIARSGDGVVLVEFGSGSSRKTELLLHAMPRLDCYVPIDVSADALIDARRRLKSVFPNLRVRPLLGDFTRSIDLPPDLMRRAKVGFFPGSTIGNFEPRQAIALLAAIRATLGDGSRLVIGADTVKDEQTLLSAYDDGAGMTAAFNLNVLAHINSVFGAGFDLAAFEHRAVYNRALQRIEMHLVSLRDQEFELLGHKFAMAPGETIHTENSHKYTDASFRRLADAAGWRVERTWSDDLSLFRVFELIARDRRAQGSSNPERT